MKYSLKYSFWINLLALPGIFLLEAALIYPTNSEFGIFMAISVPINLPHRNVFLSYNYEYNYYQPEHIYKFPPILMGNDWADGYLTYPTYGNGGRQCDNCTVSTNSTRAVKQQKVEEKKPTAETLKKSRQKRELSLITRTTFYAILKDKLERSGYEPEACLLRLICETNDSSLGEINGLLGNIVHIIFTPSSSRDEQLSSAYYHAEADGLQQQCGDYHETCPHKVLDLISAPVEQILSELTNRTRRK